MAVDSKFLINRFGYVTSGDETTGTSVATLLIGSNGRHSPQSTRLGSVAVGKSAVVRSSLSNSRMRSQAELHEMQDPQADSGAGWLRKAMPICYKLSYISNASSCRAVFDDFEAYKNHVNTYFIAVLPYKHEIDSSARSDMSKFVTDPQEEQLTPALRSGMRQSRDKHNEEVET